MIFSDNYVFFLYLPWFETMFKPISTVWRISIILTRMSCFFSKCPGPCRLKLVHFLKNERTKCPVSSDWWVQEQFVNLDATMRLLPSVWITGCSIFYQTLEGDKSSVCGSNNSFLSRDTETKQNKRHQRSNPLDLTEVWISRDDLNRTIVM